MRQISVLSLSAILFIPFCLNISLAAQELVAPTKAAQVDQSKNQSGEINIQGEGKKQDSYSVTQDNTIAIFSKLKDAASEAKSNTLGPVDKLDENIINYLTAVYLYCSIESGTCPAVLEAILEIDIINARLNKNSACPNMKQFWRIWIDSDMEQRHRYAVKTGYLTATSDFQRSVRPGFVKCEAKVKEETSGDGSDSKYFSARYAKDSPKAKVFERMLSLLETLKAAYNSEKQLNVYLATGARR